MAKTLLLQQKTWHTLLEFRQAFYNIANEPKKRISNLIVYFESFHNFLHDVYQLLQDVIRNFLGFSISFNRF